MVKSGAAEIASRAGFVVQGVGLSMAGAAILNDVTLSFPRGQMVALVGHNGSGKSSLLKILARQHQPTVGSACYDGQEVSAFQDRAFARKVAYLPQDIGVGADTTVRELVAFGRYPWHGALGRFSDIDRSKVEEAIRSTHLEHLADRMVGTLSGGERQKAWIAMLVAQDSECLLLDEPTAALDIAHQMDVLSLIRRLSREKGLGVVIVLHDINMAARFCDHIHALKGGRSVVSGTPKEIVRSEVLRTIYGVDMDVLPHPHIDAPLAYVR
ncbi:iron complex transport system ATP-binding protein [Rhizobium borbori]|uniref:Iron complex transport system ATP-binding protein n=2 Tax=Allorhizobium borbori TaxID=485907 RepID=A0A7W6K644_9HYPH|nr:iron complex transport system ATP-binding protein [Allorhizobium borbori]